VSAVLLLVASRELQRVASAVLHLISAACWLLCAEHVRRSRRRELSQVPGASRERGDVAARARAPRKTRAQMATYEALVTSHS